MLLVRVDRFLSSDPRTTAAWTRDAGPNLFICEELVGHRPATRDHRQVLAPGEPLLFDDRLNLLDGRLKQLSQHGNLRLGG
jgi:hypothetical protein